MSSSIDWNFWQGFPDALGHRPMLLTLLSLNAILAIASAMPSGKDRTNFFAWDILMLSGFLTLGIGLLLAQGSRQRLERMLDRLANRGVLHVPSLEAMKHAIEQRTGVWVHRVGLTVATSVLAAFAVLVWINFGTSRAVSLVELSVLETVWAYVVGRQLGRMAYYGAIGSFMEEHEANLQVAPGHVDAAAGFRPVGTFFFRQAMIVAVAAVFLAVWWFIIPLWPEAPMRARYVQWVHPYIALLIFVVLIEVMAFILPMLSFHRQMCRQKESLLVEADHLATDVVRLRNELVHAKTQVDRIELNDQITAKTKQYWDIENMPTWPVDSAIVRRFTLRNTVFLLPIIAESTGLHELWVKALKGVAGAIGNPAS